MCVCCMFVFLQICVVAVVIFYHVGYIHTAPFGESVCDPTIQASTLKGWDHQPPGGMCVGMGESWLGL